MSDERIPGVRSWCASVADGGLFWESFPSGKMGVVIDEFCGDLRRVLREFESGACFSLDGLLVDYVSENVEECCRRLIDESYPSIWFSEDGSGLDLEFTFIPGRGCDPVGEARFSLRDVFFKNGWPPDDDARSSIAAHLRQLADEVEEGSQYEG